MKKILIHIAMLALALAQAFTFNHNAKADRFNVMNLNAASEGYYLKQLIQNHFIICPDKVDLVSVQDEGDEGGEYAFILIRGISNKKKRDIVNWLIDLQEDFWLKKYIRGYSYYYGDLLIIMN